MSGTVRLYKHHLTEEYKGLRCTIGVRLFSLSTLATKRRGKRVHRAGRVPHMWLTVLSCAMWMLSTTVVVADVFMAQKLRPATAISNAVFLGCYAANRRLDSGMTLSYRMVPQSRPQA